MTCHTIDFDLTDIPCKRMRPMMISPSPTIESFGWGDFPLMTSEDLPILSEKPPSNAEASDVTASTLEIEYEDDTLPDSELEDDATTSLAADVSATTVKPLRQVGFDKVFVREHNVILGVHPLATGGYPLELGWEYNESISCTVDEYEQKRSSIELRRLSTLERHFKLAEMNGGSLLKVTDEEKMRYEAVSRERTAFLAMGLEEDQSDDDDLTEYTKRQMLRCASYRCLSRFV